MPRAPRFAPGGYVYHALNRAVARLPLFEKAGDFDAFERVLLEAHLRHPIRVLGYCLMPNHWHFVLWPARAGAMTAFLRWLTHTHTQRWHAHHHTAGTGHLYQGRFKAFPIEEDEHLLAVLRYVERNALRAGLCARAEDWRWSSLAHRLAGDQIGALLSAWPVPFPRDWVKRVNQPETEAELEALRRSVARNQPFGSGSWQGRKRCQDPFFLTRTVHSAFLRPHGATSAT
jgi:REP-associated tyrosine transposase